MRYSNAQAVMPAAFTLLGHFSDEALILTLWERGVSPTVVAERMAAYSNRREAENIRAKLANAQGD